MPRISAASRRFHRVCCSVREISSRSASRAALRRDVLERSGQHAARRRRGAGRRGRRRPWRSPAAAAARGRGRLERRNRADAQRAPGDRVRHLAPDRRVGAEDHHPLDQVLELAHVARPVVLGEQPQRVGRQRRRAACCSARSTARGSARSARESRRGAGAAAAA